MNTGWRKESSHNDSWQSPPSLNSVFIAWMEMGLDNNKTTPCNTSEAFIKRIKLGVRVLYKNIQKILYIYIFKGTLGNPYRAVGYWIFSKYLQRFCCQYRIKATLWTSWWLKAWVYFIFRVPLRLCGCPRTQTAELFYGLDVLLFHH